MIFESSPTLCWQPDGGSRIFFAGKSIAESGGNRLVPRERLYRPGALQDSTGAMADSWTTVSHFFNGTLEPDVPRNPYPGVLNQLLAALKDTRGTLTLLTRGPVRARAHTWQRTESDERIDFATLTIQWVADNEDAQTAASFTIPTARSAAVPLALKVQGQLAAVGAWSDDIAALAALAALLERALLAGSSFADDAEQAAIALQEATVRTELLFANQVQAAGGNVAAALLLGPLAAPALAGVRALSELASKSRAHAAPGVGQPVPKRYQRPVSLAFVARDQGQDLEDIVALNAALPDQRVIAAGTPILIRRAA